MKKIIFGSASAILAVIGFSSFKAHQKTATSYYWFSTDKVSVLTRSAITGFDQFGQTGSGGCTSGIDFCEVAYTIGQVNTSGAPLHQVTSVKSGQTLNNKATEHQPN